MIEANFIPRKRVGARGPTNAQIMFVGEAPGRIENDMGLPFVGPAGSELDRYARWAGIWTSDVYITNLAKTWPMQDPRGKQLPPSPDQIAADEGELLREISRVRPRIIVAVGAYASRWFLEDQFKSMKRDHGVPRQVTIVDHSFTLLPVIHPAAGLHSDREQVNIAEDFMQLGRLVRGEILPHAPVDEYPVPRYERINDAGKWHVAGTSMLASTSGPEFISHLLAGRTEIALDTEGTIADPWCVTFSVQPGVAWLVRSDQPECLAAINRHIQAPHAMSTTLLHYAAHDMPVLAAMGIDVNRFRAENADGTLALRDTMSEAYLIGTEPKGLKDLSWRLSGMEMESYEDLVGPTEQAIVLEYMQGVWDQLKCLTCNGEGELPVQSTHMVADPACSICAGTGKVLVGKKGQPLKNPKGCPCRTEQPYLLKTTDKCANCVNGLLVPMPEREFIFDSSKQEWRWKQPQSIGKWIKRRLKHGAAESDSVEWEDRDASEVQTDVDAAEDDAPNEYFKVRRAWADLAGRSDRAYVDALVGRLRRTTLSDVADQERVTRYACRDADATLRNAPKLQARIDKLNLRPIQLQDAAFIPMLSRMEQIGMKTDRAAFVELHAHLNEQMDIVRERLSKLIGERTNPNSPKLASLLFGDLQLPSIKLTKSGKRDSIDDDVLGALEVHLRKRGNDDWVAVIGLQVLGCIKDYREVQKIDGYAEAILEYADRADRIHTTLGYTTAATGRLTSSEPINLQTLPNPDNYPESTPPERNYGQRIRSAFIEDDGWCLVGADYAQIEMVVGAHLTQDAGMMRVFNEGLDLHKYAASLMFGVAYDEVPKRLRTQTKPLNFGAFYGLSAVGLQAQFASLPNGAIEKTQDECQELIDRYYAAFPGVLEWKQRLWEQGEQDGYVRDLFGRLRWVPGLRSNIRKVRSAAEREAANMPIQSTANGIIRIASRRLWEHTLPMLRAGGIPADIIMQTHDENVARCRTEHADIVGMMMASTMQQAVTLSVPIKVEAKIGRNLYEVK